MRRGHWRHVDIECRIGQGCGDGGSQGGLGSGVYGRTGDKGRGLATRYTTVWGSSGVRLLGDGSYWWWVLGRILLRSCEGRWRGRVGGWGLLLMVL